MSERPPSVHIEALLEGRPVTIGDESTMRIVLNSMRWDHSKTCRVVRLERGRYRILPPGRRRMHATGWGMGGPSGS